MFYTLLSSFNFTRVLVIQRSKYGTEVTGQFNFICGMIAIIIGQVWSINVLLRAVPFFL